MPGIWNSIFFGREDDSPSHSELCFFCFGVIGKTPGLISRNNFVKKMLSASAIAIMSWQDVIRSSLYSGVKECGRKHANNFLFALSESEELQSWGISKFLLSFLMRFEGHFDQISNSNNVSSLRVDFSRPTLSSFLPAPFFLEIENTTEKLLIGSEPHSHKPFEPILVFLSQTDRLWNKILWQISVHFRHS
jgi:hypothetical protein